MVVLTYGLYFDSKKQNWITLEVTSFDENKNPLTWVVRDGRSAMSNKTGEFEYEPYPSERDDDFFEEYRFKSVEKAVETYLKFHPN